MAWQDRPYYGNDSGSGRGGDWAHRILGFLNSSYPIGTYAGVAVRVHITFFLLLAIELIVDLHPMWTLRWGALLFVSVLLHEFGHVFGCRAVGGSANRILMWPLGGLAYCASPRRPWPEFVTVACGPLVNLVLAVGCYITLAMMWGEVATPSLNPLNLWGRNYMTGVPGFLQDAYVVNVALLLFNLLLVFYPFDGGRLVQIGLWTRLGYEQSMQLATAVGMGGAVVIGLFGIATGRTMLVVIAVFGFFTCYQQRKMMAHGGFGGYGEANHDPGYGGGGAPRDGWLTRWRRARAQRGGERHQQRAAAANAEIDRILRKVSDHGLQSLTDREKRTLQRETERKRNAG